MSEHGISVVQIPGSPRYRDNVPWYPYCEGCKLLHGCFEDTGEATTHGVLDPRILLDVDDHFLREHHQELAGPGNSTDTGLHGSGSWLLWNEFLKKPVQSGLVGLPHGNELAAADNRYYPETNGAALGFVYICSGPGGCAAITMDIAQHEQWHELLERALSR